MAEDIRLDYEVINQRIDTIQTRIKDNGDDIKRTYEQLKALLDVSEGETAAEIRRLMEFESNATIQLLELIGDFSRAIKAISHEFAELDGHLALDMMNSAVDNNEKSDDSARVD
ncbi:MAG: hypothetical protein K6C69_04115 [Lachnospiraceae bacterium]|nr:hypothetical protein [Lachnospiraceae bacterium]